MASSPRGKAGPESTWISLNQAAPHLGLSADALRKRLERNTRRNVDGRLEARVDGIWAKKWGTSWRVRLGDWA